MVSLAYFRQKQRQFGKAGLSEEKGIDSYSSQGPGESQSDRQARSSSSRHLAISNIHSPILPLNVLVHHRQQCSTGLGDASAAPEEVSQIYQHKCLRPQYLKISTHSHQPIVYKVINTYTPSPTAQDTEYFPTEINQLTKSFGIFTNVIYSKLTFTLILLYMISVKLPIFIPIVSLFHVEMAQFIQLTSVVHLQ